MWRRWEYTFGSHAEHFYWFYFSSLGCKKKTRRKKHHRDDTENTTDVLFLCLPSFSGSHGAGKRRKCAEQTLYKWNFRLRFGLPKRACCSIFSFFCCAFCAVDSVLPFHDGAFLLFRYVLSVNVRSPFSGGWYFSVKIYTIWVKNKIKSMCVWWHNSIILHKCQFGVVSFRGGKNSRLRANLCRRRKFRLAVMIMTMFWSELYNVPEILRCCKGRSVKNNGTGKSHWEEY